MTKTYKRFGGITEETIKNMFKEEVHVILYPNTPTTYTIYPVNELVFLYDKNGKFYQYANELTEGVTYYER